MKTRWVVFRTPWWQCLAAALPFLVEPGDCFTVQDPTGYLGPLPFERDVILNPHRCHALGRVFDADADRIVLYETENMLDPACPWRRASEALRWACPRNTWWNYSAANARPHGDEVRPLRKVHDLAPRPRFPRPIDVLFVGSMNQRRADLLERLRRLGVKCYWPRGAVFGTDLASLEACSKLLLNVHYYTPGVFEAFRVVPAVHRGTPVLSETSVDGEGAEWCPTAPYIDLVDETLNFLTRIKHAEA
jgi:hypothetical protein